LKNIRNIILSRTDRIGDVVITSSCFKPIREAYPGAKLYLLIRNEIESLFHCHPLLDGIISIEEAVLENSRSSELAERLRNFNPDCIILFHDDRTVAIAARQARIPIQIGFSGKIEPFLLSHPIPNHKKECLKHEGIYNFELLAPLGIKAPKILTPSISPDPKAREGITDLLPWWNESRPFAAYHLAAYGDKMRLPVSMVSRHAQWLHQLKNFEIVVIGSGCADAHVNRFVNSVSKGCRVWNLSGLTGLAEAAWILEKAQIIMTRDSGPAHLAAAMGCPTLAVMGLHKKQPILKRWKPLGEKVNALQIKLKPLRLETAKHFQKRYFRSLSDEELQRETLILLS